MTVAERSAADSSVAEQSSRNARGHFAPGNPGGPGRPPKAVQIERRVLSIIAGALTDEDWANMSQAMAKKASEGNISAVSLLFRTLLNGRLNAASAAEQIGLPPEVELYELGCKLHPRWFQLLDANRKAELIREAMQGERQPEAAVATPVAAGTAPESPATSAAPVTPASTPVAPAPASGSETSASGSQSAPASPPRVVPPAERVFGFRVTKGPRPIENRRKRRNHAKTSGSATNRATG